MFDLFRDPVLRVNTLVGLTLAAIGVIGFWGIGVWSSEFMRGVINPDNLPELDRLTEQRVGFVIMAQNAGAFFGAIMFAYLAQRLGRRPAFAVALIACAIMVPSAFWFTDSFPMALVMFGGMGFALLILFGGYAIYFPELFPTRLRATGTGFCYNVARFLAAAAPFTLGVLIKDLGMEGAVLVLSGVFLLGLIVLYWAPETKGKALPQ